MELLEWLQSTRLAVAVAESTTIWGYATVLTLHTFGMGIVAGLSTVIAVRFLGAGYRIPLATLQQAYPIIWLGFVMSLISGVVLFMAAATRLGTVPTYWIKMILVFVGMLMTFRMRTFMLTNVSDENPGIPVAAKLLAAGTLVVWAGAMVTGRLLAYMVY
jgi:hypothetical protein